MKKIFVICLLFLFLFPSSVFSYTPPEDTVCVVYATGIGCSHCNNVASFIYKDKLFEHSNLIMIEYEVFQDKANKGVVSDLYEQHGSATSVPVIIFDTRSSIVGDLTIMEGWDLKYVNTTSDCPTSTGVVTFDQLDINKLSHNPNIWRQDRVLIPKEKKGDSDMLLEALFSEDIEAFLEGKSFEVVEAEKILYPGGSFEFTNAVKIGGWVLQWGRVGFIPEKTAEDLKEELGIKNEEPIANLSEVGVLPDEAVVGAIDGEMESISETKEIIVEESGDDSNESDEEIHWMLYSMMLFVLVVFGIGIVYIKKLGK